MLCSSLVSVIALFPGMMLQGEDFLYAINSSQTDASLLITSLHVLLCVVV